MKLQDNLELFKMTPSATGFYTKWKDKLEYINTTMRAIRKVQTDCNLLNICTNNETILNEIYEGYVFDKLEYENEYFQYTVYIPKIKIISRIKIKEELEEYTKLNFRIFIIEDGLTLKRKIRLMLH